MKFFKETPSFISLLVIYIIAITLAYIDLNGYMKFKSVIYDWQILIGAFLGAATPIIFFIIQQKNDKNKQRKEFILLLEKYLNSAANNLIDIDKMLHRFLFETLKKYIDGIRVDDSNGRYSIGPAFVPLTMIFTLDKELLKGNTGSAYLEGLKSDVISMSLSFQLIMTDIIRQFDRIMTLNNQLGTMKLNPPHAHNLTLLENLEGFRDFITYENFEQNIPIYLKKIATLEVIVYAYAEMGIDKWNEIFALSQSSNASERALIIEDYFKDKVNGHIKSYQQSFESKLLYLGEKVSHAKQI